MANNSNVNDQIPTRGVSLKHLISLDISVDAKSKDLVDFFKEKTAGLGEEDRSYAQLLKGSDETKGFVKELAECYVSFSWDEPLFTTLQAVKESFKDKEDVFVWMDIVCMDLHTPRTRDFDSWVNAFKENLKLIGTGRVVLLPPLEPSIIRNSWCYFEWVLMRDNNIALDICHFPADGMTLALRSKGLKASELGDLLEDVDVLRSKCSQAADTKDIHAWAEKYGAREVNKKCRGFLVKYFTDNVAIALEGTEGREQARALGADGAVKQVMGLLGEAKISLDKALEIARKVMEEFPTFNAEVMKRLHALGDLCLEMGNLPGAEECFREAVTVSAERFGEDHPNVGVMTSSLASVLKKQEKFEEAEVRYRQAMEIDINAFGEDREDVAIDLNTIGSLNKQLGKNEEAKKFMERAVKIGMAVLGEKDAMISVYKSNLASVCRLLGELEEAEKLYKDSLSIDMAVQGEQSMDVAADLNNIAGILRQQKKYEESEKMYQQAIEMVDKLKGGEKDKTTATYMMGLAGMYKDADRKEDARTKAQEGHDILKYLLGPDHEETKGAYQFIVLL